MTDPIGQCRRVFLLAILSAATAVLIGAANPAHPPVPEEKPAAPEKVMPVPEEKATPPVAPPDKGETPPVPQKRPPVPPEKSDEDAGKESVPIEDRNAEPGSKSSGKSDAETPEGEKETPAAGEKPAAGEEKAEPESEEKKKAEEKPEPDTPGIPEDMAALAQCYHDLDALGVTYKREPAVNDPGACGIQYPVSVSRILPDVTLKPANLMRCATARALARWTKTFVGPTAEALGKDVKLTGLSQGSAYVCRLRNNADHGKISEHAFGNAVDVVTFEFSGHDPISIEPRDRTGKRDEGFQRAIVGTACLYFTTVLGPHADAAHEDNLHLDVMERNGGFRLCE